MKTCCCSSHCKKYFDCQLADINNEGMNIVENYHEWGSGTYTDNGCVIEHYCSELGDYKMFEPIEKEKNLISLEDTIRELKDRINELTVKFNELTEIQQELENMSNYEDDEYDDFFGVYTPEEYVRLSKEHFEWIENMAKINEEKAEYLLNKYKENLFAVEFVSDEEAEMLYYTILHWQDSAIGLDKLECELGEWSLEPDEDMLNPMFKLVVCSECGDKANNTYNYCPNCGKKMRI